jgi:hypothetical protein
MSDSPDFGTFGRFVETPVAEMDADMKSAYEFTLNCADRCQDRTRSGRPIPGCPARSCRPALTTRPSRR